MTNTWPQLESTHNTIVSSTTARCQRSYRERDFKQCFCTVVMCLGCTHIATGLMCCKAALTVRKIGVKCSIFRADHSTIRSRTRAIKGGALALTFMKSKKNLFKTIRTRLYPGIKKRDGKGKDVCLYETHGLEHLLYMVGSTSRITFISI